MHSDSGDDIWYKGTSSLGKDTPDLVVCENYFVDRIFLAFKVGGEGEVVGMGGKEDF